jgi:hypothetical protein
MPSMRKARWVQALRVLLLGLPLFACGDPIVFGSIPPSTFQFTNIVPYDGEGSSGWKVAQVTILLGRLSPRYPETALCDIEVGVPESSGGQRISTASAQQAAAAAADEAAREVLKQRLPTAVACDRFRKAMQGLMRTPSAAAYIPGAKVSAFYSSGIPRRTFP